MATWRGGDRIPTTANANHRFYFESDGDKNSYQGDAQTGFTKAIALLDNAITLLQNDNLNDGMQASLDWLFVGPDDRHRRFIVEVLKLTRNGLGADGLKIKVFSVDPEPVAAGHHTAGYVRRKNVDFVDKLRIGIGKPKGSWSEGPLRQANNGVHGSVYRGSIHVNIRELADADASYDAAGTIVHEGTHKFAGTMDFGLPGYFDTPQVLYRRTANPLARFEAINNADSFAWLTRLLNYYVNH